VYLLETDGSNVTVAVYTQEPTTYGYVASQYRLTNGVWVPSYYQQDALGSTLQLTDASQNVTDTWLYDAWGEVLARTGETVNPFQWIGAWGYYRDQATGLYYVRARDMRSSDGRWRRPDPLLFVEGPNLYVLYFVPNGMDPSGRQVNCYGGGASVVIFGGGHMSILYCSDNCGNWAYLFAPSGRWGLEAAAGFEEGQWSGSLPKFIEGRTVDISISYGIFGVGGDAGIEGSGSGVHGGVGLGAGGSAGITTSKLIKGDLSHSCPWESTPPRSKSCPAFRPIGPIPY
jgi:RHS repeat-associated protein